MTKNKKSANPNAQKALEKLKQETANEIGLKDYKDANKAELSSADNGRVGGNMVRKMVEDQQNQMQSGAQKQSGMQNQYDSPVNNNSSGMQYQSGDNGADKQKKSGFNKNNQTKMANYDASKKH